MGHISKEKIGGEGSGELSVLKKWGGGGKGEGFLVEAIGVCSRSRLLMGMGQRLTGLLRNTNNKVTLLSCKNLVLSNTLMKG